MSDIEVFPYAISLSSPQSRPILILKSKDGRDVLPVWMSPVDAGIAIADSQVHLPASSPHRLTQRILKQIGIELESCDFVEVVGHHQYVDLKFKGDERIEKVRARADEAMSFCLVQKAKFFSSREIMNRSRDLNEELAKVEQKVQLMPQFVQSRPQFLN